jgi:cytochrome P450
VAGPSRVLGSDLAPGGVVLVVLAAANRDPLAAEPLSFGTGAHACPGQAIALAIAEAGVAELLTSGTDPVRASAGRRYRPSVNTRVPLFGADRAMIGA